MNLRACSIFTAAFMLATPAVSGPADPASALDAPQWKKTSFRLVPLDASTFTYHIILSWKPDDAAAAYKVYRSTEPGANYKFLSSSTETGFIDTGVDVHKSYYYVLTSVDRNSKESSYSEEISVSHDRFVASYSPEKGHSEEESTSPDRTSKNACDICHLPQGDIGPAFPKMTIKPDKGSKQ